MLPALRLGPCGPGRSTIPRDNEAGSVRFLLLTHNSRPAASGPKLDIEAKEGEPSHDAALGLAPKYLIASQSDRYLGCYLGDRLPLAIGAKLLKRWWTH